MDMNDLHGYALNSAIATELGWKQDAAHLRWWDDSNGGAHYISFDNDDPSHPKHKDYFDPAHSLDDALKLNEPGWYWSFYEHYESGAQNPVALNVEMCAIGRGIEVDITLSFAEFATRQEAYATTYSIVWLKARRMKKQIAAQMLENIADRFLEQTTFQYNR